MGDDLFFSFLSRDFYSLVVKDVTGDEEEEEEEEEEARRQKGMETRKRRKLEPGEVGR